jgi:hypothetical protein
MSRAGNSTARTRTGTASAKPRAAQMPARRRSRTRGFQAEVYTRNNWLRILALIIGVGVMLAHVFTLKPIAVWLDWFHIDWPDIAKHFTMLSLFTLAYRLSWIGGLAHKKGLAVDAAPTWASIAICSGWGGMCEIIQHWIPARDFNIFELGINTVTPVLIVFTYMIVQKGLAGLARS